MREVSLCLPLSRIIDRFIEREKLMQKVIWAALVVAVFIGCLVVISSPPQRSVADTWGECDADRSTRNDYCQQQYNLCIANSGSNCQQNLNSCLDQSAKLHHDFTQNPATGCLFDDPSDPLPLPVLDTSREDCAQTCQDGMAMIEDTAARFAYGAECWHYCDDNYPKP